MVCIFFQVGSKSTIVNMLLTEMDGFISRDGIYLMAATNMPSLLDPAALRPGRFDTKLYVDFPSDEDRAAVIEAAIMVGIFGFFSLLLVTYKVK